ncbi:uncharacterized protein LOC143154774 [Ptiloglossa arizonensis]|uniref:uncharacterized protein LOC143154774 n=1 Tax=Ptiloglossa arizonensis TaxID=3350558 RepID=UPI003FA09D09
MFRTRAALRSLIVALRDRNPRPLEGLGGCHRRSAIVGCPVSLSVRPSILNANLDRTESVDYVIGRLDHETGIDYATGRRKTIFLSRATVPCFLTSHSECDVWNVKKYGAAPRCSIELRKTVWDFPFELERHGWSSNAFPPVRRRRRTETKISPRPMESQKRILIEISPICCNQRREKKCATMFPTSRVQGFLDVSDALVGVKRGKSALWHRGANLLVAVQTRTNRGTINRKSFGRKSARTGSTEGRKKANGGGRKLKGDPRSTGLFPVRAGSRSHSQLETAATRRTKTWMIRSRDLSYDDPPPWFTAARFTRSARLAQHPGRL